MHAAVSGAGNTPSICPFGTSTGSYSIASTLSHAITASKIQPKALRHVESYSKFLVRGPGALIASRTLIFSTMILGATQQNEDDLVIPFKSIVHTLLLELSLSAIEVPALKW